MSKHKHDIKIEKYSGSLEQLAIEIGDLRYDVLERFLILLSEKISKDGIKDAERGRNQLGHSLKKTAELLEEGSKSVRRAWEISEPYMYSADIRKKIQLEFKRKEDQQEVFKGLSTYCYDWNEETNFRLARCLLYNTNGSIKEFRQNIDFFKSDPRDVIVQAEYDSEMKRLRNFNRPFGEEKIRKEDFEVRKADKEDDLPF